MTPSWKKAPIKARVDGDFGVFSAFLMGGWNSDGARRQTSLLKADGSGYGWGDWAVWAGASVPFSEKLSANAQVAYTDNETLAATANVIWWATKDLKIEPEVSYTDYHKVDSRAVARYPPLPAQLLNSKSSDACQMRKAR